MKIIKTRKNPIWLVIVLLACLITATACQTANEPAPPAVEVDQPDQPAQEISEGIESEPGGSVAETKPGVEAVEPTLGAAAIEPDPAAIEAGWQSSPHATGFVQDPEGNNNSCARCHAPTNWAPSMDDLPESCYACKFELKAPPAYISEDKWVSIPCNVCHEPDKKGNIQPEYQWLEIAALEEYAAVETPTELCMKCHDPINVPEHVTVQVGGAHIDYTCTQCHNAHDTSASCGGVDCHEDVIGLETLIPGHDEDHRDVSCAACHDGAGMEVGPSEERGTWITFAPWSYDTATSETETQTETGMVAFTSHNLVLEASCERCHFVDNPWGLTGNVENP